MPTPDDRVPDLLVLGGRWAGSTRRRPYVSDFVSRVGPVGLSRAPVSPTWSFLCPVGVRTSPHPPGSNETHRAACRLYVRLTLGPSRRAHVRVSSGL